MHVFMYVRSLAATRGTHALLFRAAMDRRWLATGANKHAAPHPIPTATTLPTDQPIKPTEHQTNSRPAKQPAKRSSSKEVTATPAAAAERSSYYYCKRLESARPSTKVPGPAPHKLHLRQPVLPVIYSS